MHTGNRHKCRRRHRRRRQSRLRWLDRLLEMVADLVPRAPPRLRDLVADLVPLVPPSGLSHLHSMPLLPMPAHRHERPDRLLVVSRWRWPLRDCILPGYDPAHAIGVLEHVDWLQEDARLVPVGALAGLPQGGADVAELSAARACCR